MHAGSRRLKKGRAIFFTLVASLLTKRCPETDSIKLQLEPKCSPSRNSCDLRKRSAANVTLERGRNRVHFLVGLDAPSGGVHGGRSADGAPAPGSTGGLSHPLQQFGGRRPVGGSRRTPRASASSSELTLLLCLSCFHPREEFPSLRHRGFFQQSSCRPAVCASLAGANPPWRRRDGALGLLRPGRSLKARLSARCAGLSICPAAPLPLAVASCCRFPQKQLALLVQFGLYF